jgi:hypothetical protein
MAPPLLETLVSERTPGSKPLYGYAAQEIVVTTVAHTTDGWATDGAKVPPFRVRYSAAGVPFQAAGVGTLEDASRAEVSSGRAHARFAS